MKWLHRVPPATLAAALLLPSIVCTGVPPLKVTQKGDAVTVDVQTLGEYQTTVKRIRLTDRVEDRVVWEVVAASGAPQIHTVTLSSGENPVAVSDAQAGQYRVITPEGRDTFSLVPMREYLVEIWGENPSGSPATAAFAVGNEDRE